MTCSRKFSTTRRWVWEPCGTGTHTGGLDLHQAPAVVGIVVGLSSLTGSEANSRYRVSAWNCGMAS